MIVMASISADPIPSSTSQVTRMAAGRSPPALHRGALCRECRLREAAHRHDSGHAAQATVKPHRVKRLDQFLRAPAARRTSARRIIG